MTHREAFLRAVESKLGTPVLWAQKGPDTFDCSGLVTSCLLKAGGTDIRYTHNAQALAESTRELAAGEEPLPGDLAFYGIGPNTIEHVAVVDEYGGVVSADGATAHLDPRLIGFEAAFKLALSKESSRVRRHANIDFRHDLPWLAVHRNTLVDALDAVEH